MRTSMMNPIGYLLFLRLRSVIALVVGILVATVMFLFAWSEPPAAQTTMWPGQQIIAAGNVHSMALKKDGTVWAWGWDGYGQLGDGGQIPGTYAYTPVQVKGLTGIVDIDVGSSHSLALRSDGTVWAWGNNQYGQLGVGDTYHRPAPVPVHGQNNVSYLTGVVNVEAGDTQSFAVKSDGTVWGWGNNDAKQLGDGTTTERHSPVPLIGLYNDARDVGELAGGYHHGLAVKAGKVWSWGSNDYGQLGNNTWVDGYYAEPVDTGSGLTDVVTDVDAGEHHSLALEKDGNVWAWGGNNNGQIGINSGSGEVHTPMQVHGPNNDTDELPLSSITEVAAGRFHSMAVKSNGSVYAWGDGWYGQLGLNSNNDHTIPYQVHGVGNQGYLSGVTDVDAGDYHSLAVKSDGTVYAWGDNDYGQLGINNRDPHQVPYQVHGPNNVDFLTDIGAPAAPNPPGGENPPPDAKSDVTDMEPAPGDTDVPRRTNVTVTFSKEMDTSTLTKENFRLYEISAPKRAVQITNVSVTPNSEGTEVTLDPYGTSGKALRQDTEYMAVVTTGVEDLAGNTMAAPEFWRFKTGSQMEE